MDKTNSTIILMESLSTKEQMLDSPVFSRVDRGTITNTQHIYKINAKRQICALLSPEGTVISINLSKVGIERLMRVL